MRTVQELWQQAALVVRSSLFIVIFFSYTCIHAVLCVVFTWPFSFQVRHRFVTFWVRFSLWCLAKICFLTYQVEGKENIPETPGVVLCKHESAWETLALHGIFQPQVWVLKRELLWVPFLGWGIAMLKPIAIDRNSVHQALIQIVRQGQDYLNRGIWVTIFPEGTRVMAGEKGRYLRGGALLAKQAGSYVLPVAHNAGDFWARRSLIKKPGTIRLVIGPPIKSKDRSTAEINALAEGWIEGTLKEIRNIDA